MLLSLGIIFIVGWICRLILGKLKIPPLLGMILAGILLGPYGFHILDQKLLDISSEIRQIALIIILTRAGLSLSIDDLRKIGRPALLMCFVPASFEIMGMLLIGPPFWELLELKQVLWEPF